MLRLVFDLLVDERVLGKHFAHEEILGQGERFDVLDGDVHELCLSVRAQIVVAQEGFRPDLMRDLNRLLVQRLLALLPPRPTGSHPSDTLAPRC